MSKYNYFDSLERLAILSSRAVFLSCSPIRPSAQSELVSIRHSAERILCELEHNLFSDFMPPLDRSGLSRAAHGLFRMIERSSELISYRSQKNSISVKGDVVKPSKGRSPSSLVFGISKLLRIPFKSDIEIAHQGKVKVRVRLKISLPLIIVDFGR